MRPGGYGSRKQESKKEKEKGAPGVEERKKAIEQDRCTGEEEEETRRAIEQMQERKSAGRKKRKWRLGGQYRDCVKTIKKCINVSETGLEEVVVFEVYPHIYVCGFRP